MSDASQKRLVTDYYRQLRRYLAREEQEAELQRAYELGRKAIAAGAGVLDVARAHQVALTRILFAAASPDYVSRALNAAETFFMEVLLPFEAAHRGFREANAKMQQLISDLEDRNQKLAAANRRLEREIAERQRLEEMWRRYEAIVNHSRDFMTLINSDLVYVATNNAFCRGLGLKRELILGRTVAEIWGETGFNQAIQAELRRCFEGEDVHTQAWFETPSLGRRYFDVSYSPYSSGGRITHAIIVTRDITERRAAEEKVAKSQLLLARAEQLAHLGSWEWNIGTNVVDCSAELYRVYGLKPDQRLTLTSFLRLTHPEDRKRVRDHIRNGVADARPIALHHRIVRPDGVVRILYAQGRIVLDDAGHAVRLFGTDHDVTEFKEAELALSNSEARLQAILEHSPAIIALKDLQGRYLHVNQQFERSFKIERSRVVGRLDRQLFSATQAARFRANDRATLKAGEPREFEEIAQYHDGPHTSMVSKFPLRDAQGRIYALCAIATDITERKAAVEALRQSEERFRLLVSGVKDYSILMLDPIGRVGSWNPGAERIFGYSAAEILGRHFGCFYLTAEARRGRPERDLREALRQGRFEHESLQLRKDGSRFWANAVIAPIRLGGKLRGYVKVTRDMTERKQAEEALRESKDHYRLLFKEACVMQENLRNLSNRIVRVQEEERKRFSRELHDEVGQTLTAINMNLAAVSQNGAAKHAPIQKRIRDSQSLLTQAAEAVHRFARELRPAMLDELGLGPALRAYTKAFSGRTGIPVRLKAEPSIERLDAEQKTVVYRVAQESLNNVAKYSGASKVDVVIDEREGRIQLLIRDNGRGFRPPRPDFGGETRHLGILGMKERARLVGGDLGVESAPGKGTLVRLDLPVATKPARGVRHLHGDDGR